MELINQIILVGALLIALSILAGMFSSRIGAPLLLVFLGLGMLAGEDGPGGIEFNDFSLTFLVGSVALAIILFDGGLRTPRAVFRIAMWPALSLAVTPTLGGGIEMPMHIMQGPDTVGRTTPHEVGRVLQTDPGASLPCSVCGGETPTGALACPSCGSVRTPRCACGGSIQPGWRFCAWCLRPARAV